MCCNQDTDAEALAALYADSEGQLAALLERLEAETPALDALLSDLEQRTDLDKLLADLDSRALVCPTCGRPMAEALAADTNRVRSAPKTSPKAHQIGAKNKEK